MPADDKRSENPIIELEDLGFSKWFQERLSDSLQSGCGLARVVAIDKNNVTVRNEKAELLAEITGKIMHRTESNLDLPTVGDWVCVQYYDENTLAIIQKVLPRKSLLKRNVAGRETDYQLIAANVDVSFIILPAELDLNQRRLERYLMMANESDIEPVILLSKTDLVSTDDLNQKVAAIKKANPDYEIIAFSNKTGEGLDRIQRTIEKGKTYCLLGSSGVGKTTLLNRLIGDGIHATGAVRKKDGKGRHITVRRQLIILEQGGLIIDTPGMRGLGSIGDYGLAKTFSDIVTLGESCRFRDCAHINEPECAVLKAVSAGELSTERYQNYLKIQKESEHYEKSYLEKKEKDRQFGKRIKAAKKNIRKK